MRTRPNHPQSPTEIQTSQSALEAFFQCPAKFEFMTRCQPKDTSTVLQDGIDAHAILAGEERPEASTLANMYADALWELATRNGISLDYQEVEQTFHIEPDIVFKRIVDGIGTWDIGGEKLPVLIDWKTSDKGSWPKFPTGRRQYIAPKSWGFQAVSYLIPPPPEELARLRLKRWPDTIVFIISNADGHGELLSYHRGDDPLGEDNFVKACRQLAWSINNNNFPTCRGYACGLPGTRFACQFLSMCYKLKGWESEFDMLEGEHADRDRR